MKLNWEYLGQNETRRNISFLPLVIGSYFTPQGLVGWASYLPAASYIFFFSAILTTGMFAFMHYDRGWRSPIGTFLALGTICAGTALLLSGSVMFAAGCFGFAIIYADVAKEDMENFKASYEAQEAAKQKDAV